MRLLKTATELKLMFTALLAALALPMLLNIAVDAPSHLPLALLALPCAKLPFLVYGRQAVRQKSRNGVVFFACFIAMETLSLLVILAVSGVPLVLVDIVLSAVVLFFAIACLRSFAPEVTPS
ncbi:MAG: hypothetical protein GY767_01140 [Shimia sp.]|nr:hypothetical protein [Shimia sp.]MCP4825021.1 hypothetical protein [Shimia sp.]